MTDDDKKLLENWVKNFNKHYVKGVLPVSTPDGMQEAESWVEADPEDIKDFISNLLAIKDKQIEEVIIEIINLSDKIEEQHGTTLEEWKAFKRFRNTLREKYLTSTKTSDE